MHRSRLPYFFLGLSAVLAVSALVLLILRTGGKPQPPLPGSVPVAHTPHAAPPAIDPAAQPAAPEPAAAAAPKNPRVGATAADPANLVRRFAKALETNDFASLERWLGKDVLDPQTADRLKTLAASGLRLRPKDGVREVGELELNARTRWALELDGQPADGDHILLDLRRDGQQWSVETITLPPAPGDTIPKAVLADSLSVADAFLQATLKQDFEFARAFVDPATVSDAKIAGLCILFEDGGYHLRKSKPLRTMFQSQDTVGYLATVETTGAKPSAQFTLALRQPPPPANWLVAEINLDQLLADYARRVAGGDVYYSPLVKNPAGGDTIALYFEFDEDVMNSRTRRQLEIVSRILRADSGKKLTLSGHTDALGTENYNDSLSFRRAEVVRDFLIQAGVASSQIITVAKGASQPRRPNVTETGKDDPEGRRANRRTEIYLDF